MELRCDAAILHGVTNDNGTIEFRCRSNRCGHGPGIVVLHTFDINTGVLLETALYRDPVRREEDNAASGECAASGHARHPHHPVGC